MKIGFWRGATALMIVLATVAILTPFLKKDVDGTARRETALERINRTNTIRCGYILFAPYLSIDPQTGQKKGIAYDFMTALAEEMGVRIEWIEETGWGVFQEGLNANRYDMLCSAVWASGTLGRAVLFTSPLYSTNLYAFARADDRRFDQNLESADNKDVKIAVIDNDLTQATRRLRFPKAQELALPAMVDSGQYFLNVTGRKADLVLDNLYGAEQYNKGGEIKLKAIANGKSVRSFSCAFAVKLGETDFKAALDSYLAALTGNGIAAQIIDKYPGIDLPNKPL